MKLIDLLVKELPKRGGWPEGVADYKYYAGSAIAFDKCDREFHGFRLDIKISEKTASKVTREQYESALAASEGWIEWGGGSAPVNDDCIVDVKFRSGQVKNSMPARYWEWGNQCRRTNIIAYRLHKPDINSRDNDDRQEQDLNECIGQGVDVPEWNGDGLPPVGVECEFKCATGEWVAVEITAIARKGMCFVERGKNGENYVSFSREFRPIRTEAERKRDIAIEAILSDMRTIPCDLDLRDEVAVIYDAIAAGKIPGVKLEVK